MPRGNSKFGNRRVVVDNVTFDSISESRRYLSLKTLLAAGVIRDLEMHPKFTLTDGFRDHNGTKYAPVTYSADFRYFDLSRKKIVVEDVKGVKTQLFMIKWKLLLLKYKDVQDVEFIIVSARDVA